MGKKQKNSVWGLDCIINGDSEEAKEFYKKMGWIIDDKSDKPKDKNDYFMKRVLWFLAALTLTWFCITIPDSQIKNDIQTFFTCYGFIGLVCYSKCT